MNKQTMTMTVDRWRWRHRDANSERSVASANGARGAEALRRTGSERGDATRPVPSREQIDFADTAPGVAPLLPE